jgi:hypothetical protein
MLIPRSPRRYLEDCHCSKTLLHGEDACFLQGRLRRRRYSEIADPWSLQQQPITSLDLVYVSQADPSYGDVFKRRGQLLDITRNDDNVGTFLGA